jgi:photosystem II stability/assembly factor-like uncharacterized protein
MKKIITLNILSAILFASPSFAQWQSHGPFGGPTYSLTSSGSTIFIGTETGVFKSTNSGGTWSAVNNGIQRDAISSLASSGSYLIAGTSNDGIYFSSNSGATWTQRMNGLGSPFISTVFSSADGIFAGTANGVFYTSDYGMNWEQRDSGIPASYPIYSWTQIGDTIFGGTYGFALYQTNNNGTTWTSTGGGFPDSCFVYALTSTGNTTIAGTSKGIYRSSNRGVTWSASNSGFPSGMWAKSFAVLSGYIFAGTYSEGIFVSTNGGLSWSAVNNGIPDLPFPTGLPHNYPSVEELAVSGSAIIAATIEGPYKSTNNGSSWSESSQGMLATSIMDITTIGTSVFSSSEKTGVYSSADNGENWSGTNNGLLSHDMVSIIAHGSSVFVSTSFDGIYKSDDYGASWNSSGTGIPSQVYTFGQDAGRILALTNGAIGLTPGLYHTVNNGTNWTEIPTGFASLMSAFTNTTTDVYIGTWDGKIYYSNDNGANWQDKSSGLPNMKITSVLISGSALLAGTEGSGIFKSTDNGTTWSASNTGLVNDYVYDLKEASGVIYAATWGNGVYASSDNGDSWISYSGGLGNMWVRTITPGTGKIFAGTEAGVYSAPLASVNVPELEIENGIRIYPNPNKGIVYCTSSCSQKISLTISSIEGAEVFHYEGFSDAINKIDLSDRAKGFYFISIDTDKGKIKRKIVLQ